jgi:hypothetical protein
MVNINCARNRGKMHEKDAKTHVQREEKCP